MLLELYYGKADFFKVAGRKQLSLIQPFLLKKTKDTKSRTKHSLANIASYADLEL
jgi:hypothetical protein